MFQTDENRIHHGGNVLYSRLVFFLIRPNIGNKCSKNSLLFFLKHFHDGGFNFHLMNAQFYAGKMISIDFAYTIHLLQIAIEEEEVDNGCDG